MRNATILITLCLITIASHSIFAEPGRCSLNGRWFDTNGGIPMYKLQQSDSKITMDEKIIHPTCGTYLINGTTDGDHFTFKFFSSNTEEEYCQSWTQVTGVFTADCAKIKGEIKSHIEIDETPYESTIPFLWFRNIVKIISPDPATPLIITAEPKMPAFKAMAALEKPDALSYLSNIVTMNYNTSPYAWNIRLRHSPIPGKLDFDVILDEVLTNEASFTPNFNLLKTAKESKLVDSGIMGGELTLSVDYYKAVRDEKKYTIMGTNPGKTAVEQVLANPVAKHIAYQESRYKQFVADREGGVGFPVIGLNSNHDPVGGAGIMQLFKPKPTAAQVWNWRKNLEAGLANIDIKLAESRNAQINETIRLNRERQANGLPICPLNAITPLNQEQLERETIRRYNCGREYRWEPRDAPNCRGKWVLDLSCKREDIHGYDANYVNKVLNCNPNF